MRGRPVQVHITRPDRLLTCGMPRAHDNGVERFRDWRDHWDRFSGGRQEPDMAVVVVTAVIGTMVPGVKIQNLKRIGLVTTDRHTKETLASVAIAQRVPAGDLTH